ncbi:MAG: hypothetical protein OSB03_02400 [Vicinamibacterales bacterium]|nr:hypothetical protein [Vicinamibacterales bacterium]
MLAGTSTNIPKTGDGVSEMIRQIKIARATARKGRTTAIITLKTIVVNSPAELRESLAEMTDKQLLKRCSLYRPGDIADTTASAEHSLRALAKRWFDLDAEIADHDRLLDDLTAQASPTLRDDRQDLRRWIQAEALPCPRTLPYSQLFASRKKLIYVPRHGYDSRHNKLGRQRRGLRVR